MSVTWLVEVISVLWISLMIASGILNLWVLSDPSKHSKDIVQLAEAPVAWWAYLFTILSLLYVVWYKWGFTL